MSDTAGARIHITGTVQGVGFRPFVYGLATRLDLTGWVCNTSAGVDIEVDGKPESLELFSKALKAESPPLARIDSLDIQPLPIHGFSTFEIIHSQPIADAFQPISPDVSICPDCLRELFDPGDRRYRYPFINCTNCGPRFTLIKDIPYDRPNTTMASFQLCPDCAAEYSDPFDRRFHAQPVACPVCGPKVWLETSRVYTVPGKQVPETCSAEIEKDQPIITADEAIRTAKRLLKEGKIVAIKGLGGFHLACDATNPQAVAALRQRKLRVDKPFALMMLDIKTIESQCYVSQPERELLESRERPIVILQKRTEARVVPAVAPCQDTLGVMLPYTPLHYLLLAPEDWKPEDTEHHFTLNEPPLMLVMTSGNLSEEPIAMDNDEARERLSSLADAFLMHDRPIHTRCDDSVIRVAHPSSFTLPLRRSRGYAPAPVQLPWEMPPILGVGAELKNTFCLARQGYAFISQYIGDLENYETLSSFEESIAHFERLFRIHPQALAYDLHPNYLATRYALTRAVQEGLPAVSIQHHHAHIAACMADNSLDGREPVIGIAFDGTGYGDDGNIWGGEFLISTYGDKNSTGYRRAAHLAYLPLPGGDASIRKPARIALAYLWKSGLDWDLEKPYAETLCVEERTGLRAQLEHGINTPLTSSMGRLFDSVAALAGVRQEVNYEAQAAIELEALADPLEVRAYPLDIQDQSGVLILHPEPLFEAVLADLNSNVSPGIISARFHNSIAMATADICRKLRSQEGSRKVVLSGGVWQNVTLLKKTLRLLEADHFEVFIHKSVPPNDGGIALGQVVVAYHRL